MVYKTAKENYSKSMRKICKPIIAFYINGDFFKEFECIYDALDYFNVSKSTAKSNIKNALNGKYKTAYGFIWKYKKEGKYAEYNFKL